MLEREQDLFEYQISRNEIYDRFFNNLISPFRCIDNVFITTNKTEQQIEEVLDKASHKDMNININNTIDD